MSELLQFKGTWRNYQNRVLQSVDKHMKDNKIHIVAAPGSGKTTLGIELIARFDKPTLVLAPSIVIRQQWENRIIEAFLVEGKNPEEYISQNLKEPKLITIATYQALHSAMTKYKGEETEEVEGDEGDKPEQTAQQVDYTGFDLIAEMKQLGMGVLCLDECHHLRSEWWKALEEFKKAMGEVTTIALTATPPYDSTPAMWERYINVCGEIDEEITIPELVKEGSLCPHQDYVYFNYPLKDEQKSVEVFQKNADKMINDLCKEEQLIVAVQGHPFITGMASSEDMLENPSYLASLLIFLKEVKKPYPPQALSLLGVKELPALDPKWLEILLQQLLYDDMERFSIDEAYREMLTKRLKKDGFIQRRKVMLCQNTKLEKLLLNSKGKANSIKKITETEFESLGQDLRMVILTDYIRKEYIKNMGDLEKEEVPMLGVLPFFEMLRRHFMDKQNKPKLGVLCGTVVIIPATAKEKLEESLGDTAQIRYLKVGSITEEEYVMVEMAGNRHALTTAITDIFGQGEIQVLIGTKSLLGEGWDSPCINSLILASFVGSFMLSNQMRGRAIRVMKDNPNKTANIWHLVCVKSPRMQFKEARETEEAVDPSEDFELLCRRMDHFLGLHYTENTIETGIDRLQLEDGFSRTAIENNNKRMIKASKERERLKERWQQCMEVYSRPEVVEQTSIADHLLTFAILTEGIQAIIKSSLISFVLMIAMNISLVKGASNIYFLIFCAAFVYALIDCILSVIRTARSRTPYQRLQLLAKSMHKALIDQELFEDPRSKAVSEQLFGDGETFMHYGVYLTGGTGKDKNTFASAMVQFFAPIDNQRYILVRQGKKENQFFAVPDIFSKKKESAEKFLQSMRPYIGKYQLVYTRSKEGRQWLLQGRAQGFANKSERVLRRKKVKSALE